MPTEVMINGLTQRYESDVITIGRGAENTIALPHDQRLAPLHAVLKSVAGRWIVESKDGGTLRVGSGRPTQFAWINPGDVIHLTESGPELVFEPGGAVTRPPAPAPVLQPVVVPGTATSQPVIVAGPGSARPVEEAAALGGRPLPEARPSAGAAANAPGRSTIAPRGNWTVSIVVGGIAVFLLVGLGILVGGRGGPATGHVAGHDSETAKSAGSTGSSSTNVSDDSKKNAPDPKVVAGDPRSALYRLELQTADGKRSVQLGTAWVVGPRRLVTTGDVARGIALNQEFYPTALARHSLTHESVEITRMTLHPQYEIAANRLDQAVRKIEQLKSEYEETKDPTERQELANLARQQDQAAILAAEEAVNVNVAVLDVAKDLAAPLPWNASPGPSAAKIGQKLNLVGHPLSRTDLLVDPDRPVPSEQRAGRLRHAEPSSDPQIPGRWLVGFDDALRDQNWSGSPVLDSRGIVVGIYARPTPPLPGAGAGAIVTHDVTVIESLQALMSSSGKQP